MSKNIHLSDLDAAEERAARIEQEKEAKRLAREERKLRKEMMHRNVAQERMVAPFLLFLTLLVSLLLWWL